MNSFLVHGAILFEGSQIHWYEKKFHLDCSIAVISHSKFQFYGGGGSEKNNMFFSIIYSELCTWSRTSAFLK